MGARSIALEVVQACACLALNKIASEDALNKFTIFVIQFPGLHTPSVTLAFLNGQGIDLGVWTFKSTI